jgi:hypothetical protein
LGGIILAAFRLRMKSLPLPLAIRHGLAAAAGLVVLILAIVTGAGSTLRNVVLLLLISAALGGSTLLSFDLRRKVLPMPLMVLQALVAVVGFALSLSTVLR